MLVCCQGFYNWAEENLDISRPENNLKAPKFDRPTITPFTELVYAASSRLDRKVLEKDLLSLDNGEKRYYFC